MHICALVIGLSIVNIVNALKCCVYMYMICRYMHRCLLVGDAGTKGDKGDAGEKGQRGLIGFIGYKGEPGKNTVIFVRLAYCVDVY